MHKNKCCGAERKAHSGIKEVCVCTIYNLHAVTFQEDKCQTPLASGPRCIRDVWLNLSHRGHKRFWLAGDEGVRSKSTGHLLGLPRRPGSYGLNYCPLQTAVGTSMGSCSVIGPRRMAGRLYFGTIFYVATVPLLHSPAMLMCRCCGCCGEHITALLLQRKIKGRGIVQEKKHLSHSNKRSASQAATISLWVHKMHKSRYIICFHNGFALLDEVCVMFSVILPLCQPPPSFS